MSRTIATTPLRFRFGPAAADPICETAEQAVPSSFAFKLLIMFLLIMYSSIGVLVPGVEAVRPAMSVALGAVVFTLLEVSRRGTGFRIAWPESGMLLVMLGVSTIASFDAVYMHLAVDTTTNLAKIILIYVVIENTVITTDRLRAIMLTMVIGGMMPALGTIQHFLTGQLQEQVRASWVGVFANPNEDAYALAILVPIAGVLLMRAKWWLRIPLLGVIATYLLAIFLTYSRGGLVGLVAVLGLFGWKQKSFILKVLMIAGISGGIIVMSLFWHRKDDFKDVSQDTTFNQRMATIRAGMAMFRDNPLLGVGPGCSIVAYPLYVPKDAHCGCQDQLVIHNAFIQMLSETGALGFIPFVVLLGAALVHAWKLQRVEQYSPELRTYAMGLELALWGFLFCGMSGGFAWSWFPYILVGLIVAIKQICEASVKQVENV